MSRNYEIVAKRAVRDFLQGGALVTELRAIEGEEGGGLALVDPVAYVAAFTPADNRSPLIQVYAEGAIPEEAGHRHALAQARIVVAVSLVGGGEQPEDEDDRAWFYVNAIRRAMAGDYKSGEGGTRIKYAAWDSSGTTFPLVDESATHHQRAIVFEVGVEDP